MANKKLKKVYQEFNKTLAKKEEVIFGDLGIYLGGKQVVSVPNRPAYVYVRLRSSRSEVVQAFNDKVSQRWDLPVELAYKGGKYIVLGKNEGLFSDWVNDEPYMAKHADSHILNREGGKIGGDVVWTYPYQFIPNLVHPFNVPGATNVFIHSHPLWNGDSWIMAGNTGTSSFTPYRPSTGASLVLVTLDKDTGNPHLFSTTGTFIPESVTGSNSLISYYPEPTNNYIPLSVIRLVSGTTTIGWDNIYDVRQFNAQLPFIQVNTLPEIDNLQFSGLSISSTGTVAYLQSTGGGGGGTTGSFGTWRFDIVGTLETGTSMSQPYLVTDTSSISKAYLYAEYLGVTGTTIVDVLKNGISIFTGTPLSLAFNATGSWVSLTPYYSNFVRGDILTTNVLQKATNSRNVVVELSNGVGLGSSGLTVEEVEGTPSVAFVEKIKFPNNTITNEGGGVVRFTPLNDYILIQDQKAEPTDGGTATAGSWQTRDINTKVFDTGDNATLVNNQITLVAGTYRFKIKCPAFRVGFHKAKLYNITDNLDVAIGQVAWSDNGADDAGNFSEIVGQMVITTSKVFEIRHRVSVTKSTNGYGTGNTTFGVVNIFTSAEFWRVA